MIQRDKPALDWEEQQQEPAWKHHIDGRVRGGCTDHQWKERKKEKSADTESVFWLLLQFENLNTEDYNVLQSEPKCEDCAIHCIQEQR